MKRWRRPVLVAAILLLGGAVVNVGVAWLSAHFVRTHGRPYSSFVALTGRGFCITHIWPGFWFDRIAVVGPEWRADLLMHTEFKDWRRIRLPVWAPPPQPDGLQDVSTLARAYGLPWRSLRADACLEGGSFPRYRGVLVLSDNRGRRSGVVFERSAVVFLPTLVCPRGFLFNTLFYATMLALPLSLFPIRRHLRARRGRCPKCGYDLAGIAGACPECGAGIAERRQ